MAVYLERKIRVKWTHDRTTGEWCEDGKYFCVHKLNGWLVQKLQSQCIVNGQLEDINYIVISIKVKEIYLKIDYLGSFIIFCYKNFTWAMLLKFILRIVNILSI